MIPELVSSFPMGGQILPPQRHQDSNSRHDGYELVSMITGLSRFFVAREREEFIRLWIKGLWVHLSCARQPIRMPNQGEEDAPYIVSFYTRLPLFESTCALTNTGQ
ncbi:hypothetical protein TNCV_5063411 [Trichonephila clavipes]|nr:hypothetical protein TNCV_5063411 [Trichonephila clavipes]